MADPDKYNKFGEASFDAQSQGSTVNMSDTKHLDGSEEDSSFTDHVILVCIVFVATVGVVCLVLSGVAIHKASPVAGTANPKGSRTTRATGTSTGPVPISVGKLGPNGKITLQIMPPAPPKRKIYTVSHGHDWSVHEWVDAGGMVQGFSLKLISEVCKAADMRCETIWEPYSNCWKSVAGKHARTGEGLISRWYDGCIGYAMSVPRAHSVGFTSSYLSLKSAYFYKKSSDNAFNWTDVTNYKIGFMDGWIGDEKCLARQTSVTGHVLPAANIVHFTSQQDLINALIQGQINGAFGIELERDLTSVQKPQVTQGTNPYQCMLRGISVMTRKDNTDFLEGWNKGFKMIQANGKFKEMCDTAKDKNNKPVVIDCAK